MWGLLLSIFKFDFFLNLSWYGQLTFEFSAFFNHRFNYILTIATVLLLRDASDGLGTENAHFDSLRLFVSLVTAQCDV